MSKIGEKLSLDKKWILISGRANLSEDFIRLHQDKIDWYVLSIYNKTISESFVREFQDKIHWPGISGRLDFSENFIAEFKDRVFWHSISANRNMSEVFMNKFQHYIDWAAYMIFNPNYNPNYKKSPVDWITEGF